jgi:hypothetical protein
MIRKIKRKNIKTLVNIIYLIDLTVVSNRCFKISTGFLQLPEFIREILIIIFLEEEPGHYQKFYSLLKK